MPHTHHTHRGTHTHTHTHTHTQRHTLTQQRFHSLTDMWDAVIAKAMDGGKFIRVSQREEEGGTFVRTQDDRIFLSFQHTSMELIHAVSVREMIAII